MRNKKKGNNLLVDLFLSEITLKLKYDYELVFFSQDYQ